MKRNELATGVLLAYRVGSGPYTPAYVIDTATLWQRTSGPRRDAKWSRHDGNRPGRSASWDSSGTWGYLTAMGKEAYNASARAASADALTAWLAAVEDPHHLTPDTVADLASAMPDGLRLELIDNRYLIGDWVPIIGAVDRREAYEAAARERENADRGRRVELHERCVAAWADRFGDAHEYTYDPYRNTVRLPIGALAALLDIDTTHD